MKIIAVKFVLYFLIMVHKTLKLSKYKNILGQTIELHKLSLKKLSQPKYNRYNSLLKPCEDLAVLDTQAYSQINRIHR